MRHLDGNSASSISLRSTSAENIANTTPKESRYRGRAFGSGSGANDGEGTGRRSPRALRRNPLAVLAVVCFVCLFVWLMKSDNSSDPEAVASRLGVTGTRSPFSDENPFAYNGEGAAEHSSSCVDTARRSASDYVVGTRFWAIGSPEKRTARLERFKKWTQHVLSTGASKIMVAVNVQADEADSLNVIQSWDDCKVQAFPVFPWSVTGPLNAILAKAWHMQFPYILFQSMEITASESAVKVLRGFVSDDRILVAGGATNCHDTGNLYRECGENYQAETERDVRTLRASGAWNVEATIPVPVQIRGSVHPWNTFAMWRVDKLSRMGFSCLSDGLIHSPSTTAGQEEGLTISILQAISRVNRVKAQIQTQHSESSHSSKAHDEYRAFLVAGLDIEWDASCEEEDHQVATKDTMLQLQLNALNLEPGIVEMVQLCHKRRTKHS